MSNRMWLAVIALLVASAFLIYFANLLETSSMPPEGVHSTLRIPERSLLERSSRSKDESLRDSLNPHPILLQYSASSATPAPSVRLLTLRAAAQRKTHAAARAEQAERERVAAEQAEAERIHAAEHAKAAQERAVASAAARSAAKAGPPTQPPAVPSGGVWDRLAQCESGGNWQANTGNGYYGGLQFSITSWRWVGGTGYPHEHPRATQITFAKKLKARQGWGAWPACSRKLGLR